MWRKEYLACIKNNLFIIVQICLALVLINLQVGYTTKMVDRLVGSIEDSDKDTYFFQYAMAASGMWDIEDRDYAAACEKIKSLPGIEDIGEIFDLSVSVEEGSLKKTDEEESIIWVVVIVFGIIATAYLVGKKRRYVWGIYLLLGKNQNNC